MNVDDTAIYMNNLMNLKDAVVQVGWIDGYAHTCLHFTLTHTYFAL